MKLAFKCLLVFVFLFFSQGCSTKQDELYNKPALFWYKQIIKDINNGDIELADSHYISMSSEHVASPLLKEVMLVLANVHIDEEEYILANFYLDEYIKRFGNKQNIEYAKFLKIKANYLSFSQPSRNQKLLIDTINETKDYLLIYPDSKYAPLVETILVKMQLGEYYLNQEIKKLYDRMNKKESAEIYDERLKASPLKDAKLIKPRTPWYRSIFE